MKIKQNAAILDGKLVASASRIIIKQRVAEYILQYHRQPGLAVIVLGNDPASAIYVTNKKKSCLDVQIDTCAYHLPLNTTETELLALIHELNHAVTIDGILVQLPLPAHINTTAIIASIKPSKDVDGFHPYNLGRLVQGHPWLRPCTPYGIMTLLEYYHLPISGLHAVIVGASNIVGRPMALEFLWAKATITVCHSATNDLEPYIRAADLIVVATGVMDIINTDWLHSKQILIDVGIHRLPDNTLRGDVDFNRAKHKVAWITPVPGGVGPMTINALLLNTLASAMHRQYLCLDKTYPAKDDDVE